MTTSRQQQFAQELSDRKERQRLYKQKYRAENPSYVAKMQIQDRFRKFERYSEDHTFREKKREKNRIHRQQKYNADPEYKECQKIQDRTRKLKRYSKDHMFREKKQIQDRTRKLKRYSKDHMFREKKQVICANNMRKKRMNPFFSQDEMVKRLQKQKRVRRMIDSSINKKQAKIICAKQQQETEQHQPTSSPNTAVKKDWLFIPPVTYGESKRRIAIRLKGGVDENEAASEQESKDDSSEQESKNDSEQDTTEDIHHDSWLGRLRPRMPRPPPQQPQQPAPNQAEVVGGNEPTAPNFTLMCARMPLPVNVVKLYPGPMTTLCDDCGALFWINEKRKCCTNGQMMIAEEPIPLDLIDLYNNNNDFKSHIRAYNSAVSFLTAKANFEDMTGNNVPPLLKLNGQILHRYGTLHPPAGTARRNGQLYIVNNAEAARGVVNTYLGNILDEGILQTIFQILEDHNPYSAELKHLYDVERDYEATHPNDPVPQFSLVFAPSSHDRRFTPVPNGPRPPDKGVLAAVFKGNEYQQLVPTDRQFVFHTKDSNLKILNLDSQHTDALRFPLFFPRGEIFTINGEDMMGGYSRQIQLPRPNSTRTARLRVTPQIWYTYKLAYRKNSIMHKGRKLFQEYILEGYHKMEVDRILAYNVSQRKKRQGFIHDIQNELQTIREISSTEQCGIPWLMPPNHIGSNRNTHNRFLDSMRIAAHFGKPCFFLTFTCSPKWDEILENLDQGETYTDRPDIVARAFEFKKNVLIKAIKFQHILGRTEAFIYAQEWQKLSLPHIHLLIWMEVYKLHLQQKLTYNKAQYDTTCISSPL